MMKSMLTIGLALVLMSGVAFADLQGSATATVIKHVVANVAVAIDKPILDLGNIQTGKFTGIITFKVDANVQELGFSVAVSNLYKDDVATSLFFIPVDQTVGVIVQPATGMPLGGKSNVLQYNAAAVVGGYAGWATESVRYGSGDNNTFSQTVVVTPGWNQVDSQLPTGEYSGLVQLTAVI
jgi:hypothetical protein